MDLGKELQAKGHTLRDIMITYTNWRERYQKTVPLLVGDMEAWTHVKYSPPWYSLVAKNTHKTRHSRFLEPWWNAIGNGIVLSASSHIWETTFETTPCKNRKGIVLSASYHIWETTLDTAPCKNRKGIVLSVSYHIWEMTLDTTPC